MIDPKELATNALTGHWPPHYGVTNNTERIELLARELEKLADEAVDADALTERADDAEENLAEADDELKERKTCTTCDLCEEHK